MPSSGRSPRHRRGGWTLIEAAVVVCIAGVVLAVFVPTFAGRLRTSKVGEAAEQLEALHRATAAYYASRQETADGPRRRCLPAAAGPAPAEPSPDPVEVDFQAEDSPGAATFAALGFQPDRPVRYRYSVVPRATGCNLEAPEEGPLVTFRAEGDLDGDGKNSLFERDATVGEDGTLIPAGILHVLDRVE